MYELKNDYFCPMIFADTHTHIYLNAFDADRTEAIQRAFDEGVKYLFVPNIDVQTIESVLALAQRFPNQVFPMLALHPTSVKSDYLQQISIIEKMLHEHENLVKGIGETGIDLYWDKTFLKEQQDSLEIHAQWAIEMDKPLIVHARESHKEIFEVLQTFKNQNLKGIFHCFSGDYENAKQIVEMGFLMGIGGPLTYKKSTLPSIVKQFQLKHFVLETDSPFLPPVPYRGKRNESSYIPLIASKMAELFDTNIETIAKITTQNAITLFKIKDE
ncbi:MAG: TatD family hydrolase [Bacteroidales bacterium]|nr:TatD family hydrolase [Bacteroidales bacterium]MDD4576129.1 TatD family hydrolase [Bacteroidales bacterium]